MDKDRQIITQVCAKIAADLVDKTASTEAKLAEFAILASSIKDMVFEMIGTTETTTATPVANTPATPQDYQKAFQGSTLETIKVRGTQHGPLPTWLIEACQRDNVTEIYDNRDGLAVNAKRPWFKSVNGDKAYWAPRAPRASAVAR